MYDNDNYSGYGTGNNTSGTFSGAQSSNFTNDTNSANANNMGGMGSMGSTNGANNMDSMGSTNGANNMDSMGSTNGANNMNGMGSTGSQREENHDYGTYQMGGNPVGGQSDYQRNGEYDGNHKTAKNEDGKHPGRVGSFIRKATLSVSLGLFFGLFAGIGFYAVQQGSNLLQQTGGEEEVVEASANALESDAGIKLTNTNNITVVDSDVSSVVEEVMPAMVSIINNYTETGNLWGQTYSQQQEASGSGIIVAENDSELLIVSNNHVVADADELTVIFIDGAEAKAQIKGLDSDMDLAVIAVPLEELSQETMDAISIATLGDSDNLKLGEPVIAIGNALGYGQSVTNGIVSALNRELTLEDGSTGIFIQTNAAINPGNSGGALLNMNGEVVGINSNKIGGTAIEGMGYAIPITSASPIISDLMERQTRNKVEESGYIGISLQEVTDSISAMYNMPKGIYVVSVEEDSAAEEAGLMAGDIIVKFDGDKIDGYNDLQNVLQYYGAGDSAVITVMRPENGQYVEYTMDITLGTRPSELK